MQAIILAGGFGTRLKSQVGNVPKPMAPVAGRPFLCWLLEYMAGEGVSKAVLCLHHLPHMIREYFGNRYAGIELVYEIEATPLDTGGAIKQALAKLDKEQPVIVLNGDSLVQVNYRNMLCMHQRMRSNITIATSRMFDCSRYSLLEVSRGQVHSYKARGTIMPGIISNGLYIMSPGLFDDYQMPKAFSFEQDFLAPYTPILRPASYSGVDYFIDIGLPVDYARAHSEIPALFAGRMAA